MTGIGARCDTGTTRCSGIMFDDFDQFNRVRQRPKPRTATLCISIFAPEVCPGQSGRNRHSTSIVALSFISMNNIPDMRCCHTAWKTGHRGQPDPVAIVTHQDVPVAATDPCRPDLHDDAILWQFGANDIYNFKRLPIFGNHRRAHGIALGCCVDPRRFTRSCAPHPASQNIYIGPSRYPHPRYRST